MAPPHLPERLIDGRALPAEGARAVFGDIQAIFQTHAEFAIDGDGGLVAETHAGFQLRLVAAYQVGPFMAVQPDAVAGPVGQPRNLVARTESEIGDDPAR